MCESPKNTFVFTTASFAQPANATTPISKQMYFMLIDEPLRKLVDFLLHKYFKKIR